MDGQIILKGKREAAIERGIAKGQGFTLVRTRYDRDYHVLPYPMAGTVKDKTGEYLILDSRHWPRRVKKGGVRWESVPLPPVDIRLTYPVHSDRGNVVAWRIPAVDQITSCIPSARDSIIGRLVARVVCALPKGLADEAVKGLVRATIKDQTLSCHVLHNRRGQKAAAFWVSKEYTEEIADNIASAYAWRWAYRELHENPMQLFEGLDLPNTTE
jgi:hypothetical protein